MQLVELSIAAPSGSLSVRRLVVQEAVSTLTSVSVWARSDSPTLDLAANIGKPAGVRLDTGRASRIWTGLCSYIEQVRAERRGDKVQSLYYLRISPMLWQLEHTLDCRIYQRVSIPDITEKILQDWHIPFVWRIDRGQYPTYEYKVQYGESLLTFLLRLWEEAGIAFTFPDEGGGPTLTLSDALQSGPRRPGPPVPYEESPTNTLEREYVNELRLVHEVRPGAVTLRDYDLRRPALDLKKSATSGSPEDRYEHFGYLPGGFHVGASGGPTTPAADDKGSFRHDANAGEARAKRVLEALRADRAGVELEGNLHDLQPGMILSVTGHPQADLGRPLLVTDAFFEGTAEGEWRHAAHAVFADVPFRPPIVTPRPNVAGVTTVRVVGPKGGDHLGQQIHTDEFGRVRVQFPWDRDGTWSDESSVWMRVSQGWGGTGYGWINLPRVGQEVLVTFLEGDPDRPVVLGRASNATQPVIYKLPDYKVVSAWKSDTSPGGNGYNEIKFDDTKGEELFSTQAEKNRRLLVKNDETLTVGRDRSQTVIADELETVDHDRVQVTRNDRHAMVGSESITQIDGDKRQLIGGDEVEYNYGPRKLLGISSLDAVVKGARRERIEWDLHRHTVGARKERVDGDASCLVYQGRQEKVGQSFARESGGETHLLAGKAVVGEAPDITVQGPGGFLRIDATGVTISGMTVDINVSGSAGHGHGSHPREVAEAIEAKTKTGVVWDVAEFADHAGVAALRERFADKALDVEATSLRSLELVRFALSSDVSTPPGGAVFWSGGDLAGAGADQLAAERTNAPVDPTPSKRLEGTPGGAGLVTAVKAGKDDWAVQQPAWSAISKKLAVNASGPVTVVVSYYPLKNSAIFREEVKLLAANPKVTSIKAVTIAKHPNGDPILGPKGEYTLVPVSLKDVLAPPPPPPPFSPPTS